MLGGPGLALDAFSLPLVPVGPNPRPLWVEGGGWEQLLPSPMKWTPNPGPPTYPLPKWPRGTGLAWWSRRPLNRKERGEGEVTLELWGTSIWPQGGRGAVGGHGIVGGGLQPSNVLGRVPSPPPLTTRRLTASPGCPFSPCSPFAPSWPCGERHMGPVVLAEDRLRGRAQPRGEGHTHPGSDSSRGSGVSREADRALQPERNQG